jgi:prolyl oligopeptidase
VTSVVNDMFVCAYLVDAHTKVRIHDLDGRFAREVQLPGIGSTYGFGGRRDDPETYLHRRAGTRSR